MDRLLPSSNSNVQQPRHSIAKIVTSSQWTMNGGKCSELMPWTDDKLQKHWHKQTPSIGEIRNEICINYLWPGAPGLSACFDRLVNDGTILDPRRDKKNICITPLAGRYVAAEPKVIWYSTVASGSLSWKHDKNALQELRRQSLQTARKVEQ